MSKVSTKGQVTIPLAIREKLGIHAGTEVEFSVEGERAVITRKDGLSRGEALVEHIRLAAARARTSGMTTDEIMALTRGE